MPAVLKQVLSRSSTKVFYVQHSYLFKHTAFTSPNLELLITKPGRISRERVFFFLSFFCFSFSVLFRWTSRSLCFAYTFAMISSSLRLFYFYLFIFTAYTWTYGRIEGTKGGRSFAAGRDSHLLFADGMRIPDPAIWLKPPGRLYTIPTDWTRKQKQKKI